MSELNEKRAKSSVAEMTIRVIVLSVILSGLISVLTVYSGSLTGMYSNASIIAAVIGYAILSISKNKPSILEANMVQTIGSAGGVAALGMINAYIAALLLGMHFNFIEAVSILVLGSAMGVLYVIMFRRVLIIEENLPFPGGIACAETLKACSGSGQETSSRAKLLFAAAIIAAAIVLLRDLFKIIPAFINLTDFFPAGFVVNIAVFPFMVAMGYVIGIRSAIMFFIGGVVMWWLVGPIGFHIGILPNPQINSEPLGTWMTSPAVGLIAGGSLMPLILNYKAFVRALKVLADINVVKKEKDIPLKTMLWGIAIVGILTCVYFSTVFSIPTLYSVLSIVVIFFAVFILTRCVGEVGLNPGTLIGWVTLGIIAIFGLRDPIKLLMLGVFMMTASGLATDIMQDLKTGYLVGATPRAQIIGEFIGILPGALMGVFATYVIIQAHGIGSPNAPYPMGFAWKGVAESLAGGESVINLIPLIISTIIGAVSTLFGCPALASGIAMFVPIGSSVAMLFGGLARLYVKKKYGKGGEEKHISTASGLLVGEGFAAMALSFLIFIKNI